MKTASVRQLRTEFPKVLAWVRSGEEVVITRRRRPVATLVPAGEARRERIVTPDFAGRLRATYGRHVVPADAMEAILSDNKGRY